MKVQKLGIKSAVSGLCRLAFPVIQYREGFDKTDELGLRRSAMMGFWHRRENGDPKHAYDTGSTHAPPFDGVYRWVKGRVEVSHVLGVERDDGRYEYEVWYIAGKKDLRCFEEKDIKYLRRLRNERRLRNDECGVWWLWGRAGGKVEIGQYWHDLLIEHKYYKHESTEELEALLADAEKNGKQLAKQCRKIEEALQTIRSLSAANHPKPSILEQCKSVISTAQEIKLRQHPDVEKLITEAQALLAHEQAEFKRYTAVYHEGQQALQRARQLSKEGGSKLEIVESIQAAAAKAQEAKCIPESLALLDETVLDYERTELKKYTAVYHEGQQALQRARLLSKEGGSKLEIVRSLQAAAAKAQEARCIPESSALLIEAQKALPAAQKTLDTCNKLLLIQSKIKGSAANVQKSLQFGADPETTDENGNTSAHLAASIGESKTVQLLCDCFKDRMKRGKYLQRLNKKNESPLHCAVRANHPQTALHILKLLHTILTPEELSVCLGQPNYQGNTTAYLAAVHGQYEVISAACCYLSEPLRRKAYLRQLSGGNESILFLIIAHNHPQAAFRFIELLAKELTPTELGDHLVQRTKNGESVLSKAVNLKQFDVVKKILLSFPNEAERLEALKLKQPPNSLLSLAVEQKSIELVGVILSCFSQQGRQQCLDENTMTIAEQTGDQNILELLQNALFGNPLLFQHTHPAEEKIIPSISTTREDTEQKQPQAVQKPTPQTVHELTRTSDPAQPPIESKRKEEKLSEREEVLQQELQRKLAYEIDAAQISETVQMHPEGKLQKLEKQFRATLTEHERQTNTLNRKIQRLQQKLGAHQSDSRKLEAKQRAKQERQLQKMEAQRDRHVARLEDKVVKIIDAVATEQQKTQKDLAESKETYEKQFQQQRQVFAEEFKRLEAQLKEAKPESKEHKELQDRIQELESNQQQLMEKHRAEQELSRQQIILRQNPQLCPFYNAVHSKLSGIFAAIRIISTGLINPAQGWKSKALQKGISFGISAIPIPFASAIADFFTSGIKYAEQKHTKSKSKRQSALTLTFLDAEIISEAVARALAYRYEEQIRQLTPKDAERLGKCAVNRIMCYMNDYIGKLIKCDGSKQSHLAVIAQLVSSVFKVRYTSGWIQRTFRDETIDEELKWTDRGIFTMPGIKIPLPNPQLGREPYQYFSGTAKIQLSPEETADIETEPETYGYRLGTAEEAKSFGLRPTERRRPLKKSKIRERKAKSERIDRIEEKQDLFHKQAASQQHHLSEHIRDQHRETQRQLEEEKARRVELEKQLKQMQQQMQMMQQFFAQQQKSAPTSAIPSPSSCVFFPSPPRDRRESKHDTSRQHTPTLRPGDDSDNDSD